MKTSGAILALALLVSGCASATQAPQAPAATLAPLPTLVPYPTYTPQAAQVVTQLVTVEVTKLVNQIITATPLPATATEAETATPAPTDTEVPTANAKTATALALGPLVTNKTDGNYLVNVDIAPGVWRNDGSNSSGSDCYWAVLTKTGDIIKNYIGAGKGTMFVAANAYEVQTERCGNWAYLGE